ncbi:Rho termination factor N-terminal domain-containing protein [Vulcanococcus sp.]|uniref:Rho termination factor N-terminal domain-containing protein n=1 Tax=Vulcanococcus sp. TaxID=2856995 RepID=UPI0037D99DCC
MSIARVDPKPQRKLHPLPRGLVELYGLLAVLFVLVPEWMADGALAGLRAGRDGSDLPMTTTAWQRIPELRLASMNLVELRDLARALRLWGYSSLNREQLSASLLRKIQARRGKAL